MTAIDWTASWDATKNISPIHIVNGVTAMFLTFFIANYVDDYAGDGIIRRLARGVGAAIVYAVFGGIALVGMCAVALLAFHLMKLGPTKFLARATSWQGGLVTVSLALLSLVVIPVLLVGMIGEYLSRRRRRRLAKAFSAAAAGTGLAVVPVDYPLLQVQIDLKKERGLEFLPEGIRGAAFFANLEGRVEGALAGRLHGVEMAIFNYWFNAKRMQLRTFKSTRHRLTVVAVRLYDPDPTASADRTGAQRTTLVERIIRALGGGWTDMSHYLRFYASSREPEDGIMNWNDEARIGDWLVLGHEGDLTEPAELHALIADLGEALGLEPSN